MIADADRFWSKVVKTDDCWVWNGSTMTYGYGKFYRADGTHRAYFAHRYSWELHRGPIPAGMLVCHRCDNPPCVNPEHLFLGSIDDNMADRNAKGRQARGERNGSSKLTADQVNEIRRRYADGGVTQRELAGRYRVSVPLIGHITSGRKWRHLLGHADLSTLIDCE